MNKYTIDEREIKCPGCGLEFRDSWDYPNEGEFECECGVNFHFSRGNEVRYSTEEIPKLN